MDHTNQDVIGENCLRNDAGELALTDDDKMKAWVEHYARLDQNNDSDNIYIYKKTATLPWESINNQFNRVITIDSEVSEYGVGNNSIECLQCRLWVHKMYSGNAR